MKNILLLVILINIHIFASSSVKEIFVVSESWKGLTEKDGSGLYFDIVRMVYKPVGIDVKTKIYPYNRSSMMVEKKMADMWLGSYLDEEEYAIYPKYYFDQDRVTAMFKKKKFPNFSGVKTLEGKNVCWVRGYAYDEYIEVPMKQHERNDRKSILQSLEKDRFDFFLDDEDDMKEGIKANKFKTDAYSFVSLLSFNIYPAFRDDAKGKELKEIWDKQMKKLVDDGSLKKLFIKYNYEEDYLY